MALDTSIRLSKETRDLVRAQKQGQETYDTLLQRTFRNETSDTTNSN